MQNTMYKLLTLLFVLATAAEVRADMILSGDNSTGQYGSAVTGLLSQNYASYIGQQFTLTSAVSIATVEEKITYYTTNYSTVSLAIYSNSGNSLGSLLATSSGTQSYSSGSNSNNTQFSFSSGPTLAAGTYWAVLSTTAGQIGGAGSTYNSSSGSFSFSQTGTVGSVTDYSITGPSPSIGSPQVSNTNIVYQLEVDGTLTALPEPSSVLMLASSFPCAGLGLVVMRVRKSRTQHLAAA